MLSLGVYQQIDHDLSLTQRRLCANGDGEKKLLSLIIIIDGNRANCYDPLTEFKLTLSVLLSIYYNPCKIWIPTLNKFLREAINEQPYVNKKCDEKCCLG